jgi:hypothetical protein
MEKESSRLALINASGRAKIITEHRKAPDFVGLIAEIRVKIPEMRQFPNSQFFVGGVVVLLLGVALAYGGRDVKLQSLSGPADDNDATSRPKFDCLPKDVKPDEVVQYGRGRKDVTVEDKLVEMKARCEHGKLVDAKGKEIRFFRTSCWGNPPPDYQEIRKQENDELEKLKKRYTVIVFGCDPMIQ